MFHEILISVAISLVVIIGVYLSIRGKLRARTQTIQHEVREIITRDVADLKANMPRVDEITTIRQDVGELKANMPRFDEFGKMREELGSFREGLTAQFNELKRTSAEEFQKVRQSQAPL